MNLQEIRNQYNSSEEFFQAVLDGCIKLAEEQPDFVYNPRKGSGVCVYNGPCVYRGGHGSVVEHGPDCKGCIVGQSLQHLGWDDAEELSSILSAKHLLLSVDPEFSEVEGDRILARLDNIQSQQDEGKSWSEAVTESWSEPMPET